MFLLFLFIPRVAIFNHRGVRYGGRVVFISVSYRNYFIFFSDCVILGYVPSPPSKRGLASSSPARTVSRLATVSTGSNCRLEYQEIRLGDFECVETRLETVTLP